MTWSNCAWCGAAFEAQTVRVTCSAEHRRLWRNYANRMRRYVTISRLDDDEQEAEAAKRRENLNKFLRSRGKAEVDSPMARCWEDVERRYDEDYLWEKENRYG